MAITSPPAPDTFVTVPGDRHSEVARTLAEPVPQALSLVGFTPASWMSTSICSFGVAAAATLLVGWLGALGRRVTA